MFCPKCGNTLQPGETFCAACGTAVSQQGAANANAPQEPKKNPLEAILADKKKLIIAAGALVAVILVIVLISGVFSTQSSASKVAEAYVTASIRDDVEGTLELMPEFILERMAEEEYDMKEYDFDKLVRKIKKEADIDEPDDEIEIDIIENEPQDDDDDKEDAMDAVKAYLKMIDCYDEYKNVDDAMYVEIGYEADDDDGERNVLCVKMSGKWYVLG